MPTCKTRSRQAWWAVGVEGDLNGLCKRNLGPLKTRSPHSNFAVQVVEVLAMLAERL